MRPKRGKTADYERLLAQERLILDATEAIVGLLDEGGVTRQELAKRLGKSKSFVSQLLSGERNMTLRTLADLGHALGTTFSVVPKSPATGVLLEANALRAVFTSFGSAQAKGRWLPTATVEERLKAAEDVPVNVHEYALAA